jgi:hypothetical protein
MFRAGVSRGRTTANRPEVGTRENCPFSFFLSFGLPEFEHGLCAERLYRVSLDSTGRSRPPREGLDPPCRPSHGLTRSKEGPKPSRSRPQLPSYSARTGRAAPNTHGLSFLLSLSLSLFPATESASIGASHHFGVSQLDNDPSAGSPTETLLRLLLPPDNLVCRSFQIPRQPKPP